MASAEGSSRGLSRTSSFSDGKQGGGEPITPTMMICSRKPTAGDDSPMVKRLFQESPQSSSSGTNKRPGEKRIKKETTTFEASSPKLAIEGNHSLGYGSGGDQQLTAKLEEDQATPPPQAQQQSQALSKLVGPPAPRSAAKTEQRSPQIRQAYAVSIPTVKTALIAFLTTASTEDVDRMIQEANSAFKSLKALGADYSSFYDGVRAYILYCSQLSAAEQELQDNKDNIDVLAQQKKLSKEIAKGSNAVSKLDHELQHELSFIVQLESQVESAREALNEMEVELEERQMRVAELEDVKFGKMKVLDKSKDEVEKIEEKAGCIRENIMEIVSRLQLAKVAVELSRAELSKY